MQIGDFTLTPYVFGWPPLADGLARIDGFEDPRFLDVLAVENALFGRLLNAANAQAFGNLGMPLWVQLDCATLPSAYHGFALPRADVPADTWRALCAAYARILPDGSAAALDSYEGLVPVSAFCAVRTPVEASVVAFSLFTILRGLSLGVRSKALGLLAHGAAQQVGTTQYDNAAVRVHAAFGSLEVVAPRAHGHTRPEKSFVYRLDVPAADVLRRRVMDGRMDAAPPAAHCELIEIDDTIADRMEARAARGERIFIHPPGVVVEDGRAHVGCGIPE